MGRLVKFVVLENCRFGQPDANDGWHYKIMLLIDKSTYRADLYGPNYDDFDWHYKDVELRESSSEFTTKEEVIAYAEKEWIAREEEFVAKTQEIDKCILGQPNSNAGWQYKIMIIADKLMYRADLYDSNYDDLDWKYDKEAVQKSSPEFDTKEEAVAYAEQEWVYQKKEK
jgi:hypothetical protein